MRSQPFRRLAAAGALAATLVVTGCGSNLSAQNLCTNAKSFATSVDDLAAAKPDGSRIAALTTKVDAALTKLDQLQAVSEGRFDSAISTLRANLESVKQTLAAASNKSFATAAPQLTAALKDVSTAYSSLAASLATQCKTG